MDKQSILKYLANNSTIEEAQIVEKWIISSKENQSTFNKIKTEYIVDSFDTTSDEIFENEKYAEFKSKFIDTKSPSFIEKIRPFYKYAAVVILFFSVSFFLYNSQNKPDSLVLPENEVTVKFENGKVFTVDENGTAKISNSKGLIVGQQNGTKLVYAATGSSNTLEFNTLRVPFGKTFQLELSDGTKAYLNAGSSIKYPVEFLEKGNREVVVTGEAFLEVAKDSEHPFVVHAGQLNVRVLGTQFNVYSYPDEEVSEIVLVEGSVGVYSKNEKFETGKNLMLEPGNMARFDRTERTIKKETVRTDMHTSWMRGEYIFKDEPFENILKKLERHYNVQFLIKNQTVSKEKFSGTFITRLSIDKIMENLKINYGINYEINDNAITIK